MESFQRSTRVKKANLATFFLFGNFHDPMKVAFVCIVWEVNLDKEAKLRLDVVDHDIVVHIKTMFVQNLNLSHFCVILVFVRT